MKLFKKLVGSDKDRKEGKGSAGSPSKALPPCEIGPDAVNYRETVHHGPVSSPLCMAVDPVQGLVAVGGEDGSIKIWGRRGVERKLKSRSPGGSALCLAFAPGRGILLAGTAAPSLQVWSLKSSCCTSESCETIPLPCVPRCLNVPTEVPWCWIGTASGAIHVASIASKELSTYAITPSAIGLSSPCDVVACTHLHREGGQLAVALSNGYILLWDVRQNRLLRKYTGGCGESRLLCAQPSPGGRYLAAGYENGEVYIWMMDKEKTPAFTIKEGVEARPARSIDWGMSLDTQGKKTAENYTLVVLGGTSAASPPAIMLVSGAQFVFKRFVELDEQADIMCLAKTSPWQGAELALSFALVLRAGGGINAVIVGGQEGDAPKLEGPLPLYAQIIDVVSSVPVQLAYRLSQFVPQESAHPPGEGSPRMPWELDEDMVRHPMFGGVSAMPPLTSPSPCFMVTGYDGASLKIWDVRTASLLPVDVPITSLGVTTHCEALRIEVCTVVGDQGGEEEGGEAGLALILHQGSSVEVLVTNFEDRHVSLRHSQDGLVSVSCAIRYGEEGRRRGMVVVKEGGAGGEGEGREKKIEEKSGEDEEEGRRQGAGEGDGGGGDDDGDDDDDEHLVRSKRRSGEEENENDDDDDGDDGDGDDGDDRVDGDDDDDDDGEAKAAERQQHEEGSEPPQIDKILFSSGFQSLVRADLAGEITCSLLVSWAGRLIVGCSMGGLSFIDLSEGRLLASHTLSDPAIPGGGGEGASPRALCVGPLPLSNGSIVPAVLAILDSGSLLAFDLTSGSPLPTRLVGDASTGEVQARGRPISSTLLTQHGIPLDNRGKSNEAAAFLLCTFSGRVDVHPLPLPEAKRRPPIACQDLPFNMCRSWTVQCQGEPAAVCMSSDGSCTLLGLPSLAHITDFQVAAAHTPSIHTKLEAGASCVLPDGRTFVSLQGIGELPGAGSIARGSIFAFENALQLPQLGGDLYRPDLAISQAPRERQQESVGLFGAMAKLLDVGNQTGGWDDVFPLKSRRQGAASGSAASSPAAAGREKSGNVVDEDEQRRLLMGGKKIDNRGKSPYKSEGRGGDIGGAASAAMQAKNALMERGEKLSELQDKANRLQDAAQNFEGMIREHNQKMAKKKWYQL